MRSHKVTHVQLTKALFVPNGNGVQGLEFKRTLSDTTQSYPGIKLSMGTFGVECEWKGSHFTVPYNMIECISTKIVETPEEPYNHDKEAQSNIK